MTGWGNGESVLRGHPRSTADNSAAYLLCSCGRDVCTA
jgi:hypothetical protein